MMTDHVGSCTLWSFSFFDAETRQWTMVNRFVLLAGLSIAAGSDARILSHNVRHLIGEDFQLCPFADAREERLLYNIEIRFEGLGGCADEVLLNVGAKLQQIVDEVEAKIPQYDYEEMQTLICPKPVVESDRRGLRLAESNRELANVGRYRYRGGGKCRRCRKNNGDRRLLQEAMTFERTCLKTDKAIYDADLADLAKTAVEAVDYALSDLKETALQCPNLKAGKALVTWAKQILEECKAVRKESLDAVARARAKCKQASLASSEAQVEPLLQQAVEAFDTAMKAIDNVQQLYSEMQDILDTTAGDITVEGAFSMAEMATYLAEISATAVKKGNEKFLQLQERALECGDLAGTQLIDSVGAQLEATRKARRQSARKARKTRRKAQQASVATTQEALFESAKLAEESCELAFLAAKRAQNSYLVIRDEVARPICGKTEAPEEDEATPLKQWLVLLMDMLYERIPEPINKAFDECSNETDMSLDISIDALEEYWEEKEFITKEDCDNLSEIPKR
jgi:hypothetical protein